MSEKQGWECPKCGSIWSPEVENCKNCDRKPNNIQTEKIVVDNDGNQLLKS